MPLWKCWSSGLLALMLTRSLLTRPRYITMVSSIEPQISASASYEFLG